MLPSLLFQRMILMSSPFFKVSLTPTKHMTLFHTERWVYTKALKDTRMQFSTLPHKISFIYFDTLLLSSVVPNGQLEVTPEATTLPPAQL